MADSVVPVLSAREQEIVIHAVLSMKEAPQINFEKLADRLGMGNIRSASNAWTALRKKFVERDPRPDLVDTDVGPINAGKARGGTATPKKTAGRKRKSPVVAISDAENNGQDNANGSGQSSDVVIQEAATPSPAKKRRGRPPKARAALMVDLTNEEGGPSAAVVKTERVKKERVVKKVATKKAPVKKEEQVATVSDHEGNEDREAGETDLSKIPQYVQSEEAGEHETAADDQLLREADEAVRALTA